MRSYFICALGRIRTLNPQSRNLVFYPVELRVQKRIANIEIYLMFFEFYFHTIDIKKKSPRVSDLNSLSDNIKSIIWSFQWSS